MVFGAFGALPPEVNSGRIYSGPGSAPLLAAAAAWDGLAAELQSTAASYVATVTELRTAWQGPSSTSMAAAAAPYIEWLESTAAQAEQAGVQAKAAAAAYEAAFAASVPPPVIAANRALLAALIATNFLGQNTPAISATEAQYAEMWAQDAAAMYGYAGSAATATQLTPFSLPPKTTNDTGRTEQSDAIIAAAQSSATSDVQSGVSKLAAELPQVSAAAATDPITQLTSALPLSLTDITNILKTFNTALNTVAGPYTPLGIGGLIKNWYQVSISIPSVGTGIQGIGPLLHPKPLLGVLAPLLHSDLLTGSSALQGVGTVSATAGRAGLVGSLSVPSTWASAVPAVRTVASELPETAIDAAPAMAANAGQGMFGPTALSSLAGRAVGGTATRAAAGTTFRVPGAVAVDDLATTSTVIVIPPSAK
ncbi:PPE family protein [Mycobacterium avium subsp. hominissuis]|uniref:PPE family protein n=1 Tax=Mycobacterium avium TaxID=1764 RepID=UPI0029398A31|nr:PPE family protein [Mycobacterium avium]MDV3249034.1 PPE family protein [Mycobacterium avium subsp. hominissuis]MDV3274679.1 PPE family protein [Mycobacterium avium subsp. hominissuis]MDV3322277.1 PPE family protein [Mycobacterium avium subsp. hominissuis]